MDLVELARRFVQANPPVKGRVIQCSITGSHLYGFPSPDSDLDIKGIHLAPTISMLGLADIGRQAPHDRTFEFEGMVCDLTTNEVGHVMRALTKGDGNMLERLFSPMQLNFLSSTLEELRELATGSLSKRSFYHYAGFLSSNVNRYMKTPTLKSLLYAYRVALTGVHLLRTGRVEASLEVLAKAWNFSEEVMPLIELKRESIENSVIRTNTSHDLTTFKRLEAMLEIARDESPLPAEPQNMKDLDAWLVRVRRQDLGA